MIDLSLKYGVLAALLCGCPAEGGSDEGGDTETSDAMTDPTSDPSMTSAGPTSGSDPMTTAGPTTTDTPTTSPSSSVTTDETDTGPEPQCEEPDPSVDAMFVVDVGDWPFDTQYNLTIDAQCTIASSTAADTIELELDCDHDGTPRTVTISAAATDEGTPVLPVDLTVALHYRFHEEWELEERIVQRVAVRDASTGDLLLAAADTGPLVQNKLNPFPPDVDPIALAEELLLQCGGGAYDVPLELTFTLGDELLTLQGGQHDTMAIPESDEVFAIDLATATGIDPDVPTDAIPGHIELLVRRVAP